MTTKLSDRKELLGELVDRDTGGLYRPLTGSAVIIPSSVELIDDGLHWRTAFPLTYKPTGNGLLEDFIKLGDASEEQIRDYARKWGVLEICTHGYPRSHNADTWPRSWAGKSGCEPLKHGYRTMRGVHYEEGWEPIARWRHFAWQGRAILNLAARLNQESVDLADEWKVVYEEYQEEFKSPQKLCFGNFEDTRRLVSFAVNDWLQLGAVRPQFVWKAKMYRLELGGPTLFGHLAVQLALLVGRTDAVVFCSHCGVPYLPSRQPNRNQRHFCSTCRSHKVDQRLASRDYRASLLSKRGKISR